MPLRNITLGSRLRSKVRTVRKLTTKDNSKVSITRDPKNPKTRFYTKFEKNQFSLASRITHMTPEAHRVLKENPELTSFLETEISKRTPIKARLETQNGRFILREINAISGNTHHKICELLYKDKNTGKVKKYFVKLYSQLSYFGNAEAEFLAVKEIERLGFNIIKPQFAITNIKKGDPNVIIYDFTNLETYHQAILNQKINGKEIIEIEEAYKKLQKALTKRGLEDFYRYHLRFEPNHNVFVRRLANGKLKFYFTDLLWGDEKIYKKKREEYL